MGDVGFRDRSASAACVTPSRRGMWRGAVGRGSPTKPRESALRGYCFGSGERRAGGRAPELPPVRYLEQVQRTPVCLPLKATGGAFIGSEFEADSPGETKQYTGFVLGKVEPETDSNNTALAVCLTPDAFLSVDTPTTSPFVMKPGEKLGIAVAAITALVPIYDVAAQMMHPLPFHSRKREASITTEEHRA